jgi:ABC-type xylose transport system substrate-binding protein
VTGTAQPASLLVPIWVDPTNMNSTVIKDQFVDKATLCSKAGAAACTAAGIS